MAKHKLNEALSDPAALFDLMDGAVCVLDKKHIITYCNESYAKFIGQSRSDIVGRKLEELDPTGDVELLESVLEKILTGELRRGSFRSHAEKPGGSHVYVDVACKAIEVNGDVEGVLVVAHNITELERARRDLEIQKEKYQHLIDNMNEALLVVDAGKKIAFCNEAYARAHGKRPEELIGSSPVSEIHPDDAPRVKADFEKLLNGELEVSSQVFRVKSREADGWIYLESEARPVERAGQKLGVEYIARDITRHRRADEALKASEAKYRDLVQNANSIILRMDTEGNVTFFNEFAESFFGYSEKEILGKNVVGTIVPETESDGRDLRAMIHDIGRNSERYVNNENENMRKNGERVWIAWTNRPVYDEAGKVVEILCIGNDITPRKKAAEALAKAHGDLEEQQGQLMRDIRLAANIHRSLLPRPIKNRRIIADIKHVPLLGLGGDYVSLQLFMQRYLAVSVFDVTGHGLAASLLAGRVHSEIYRLVRNNYSPKRILKAVNSFLYENFPRTGLFITLFTARINFLTGSVRYSGAGHPPAILKRAGGKRVELLDSESPLAGVIEPDDYTETEAKVRLGPGDALVLYTDGVSDVMGEKNHTNGLQELAELISGIDFSPVEDNLSDHVYSLIKPHLTHPPHDDMTIFTVKLR
jgi:PAS domain S-box-containing protein